MQKLKINHLAVWIASIIVQFLPPLWYDRIFFGIRWSELNNLNEDDFANFNPLNYIWALLAAVALSYMLAWLFKQMNIQNTFKALQLTFLFWFSFLFLEVATQNAFTLRSFELTLIDELLVLIKYEVITIILMLWKKYELPST